MRTTLQTSANGKQVTVPVGFEGVERVQLIGENGQPIDLNAFPPYAMPVLTRAEIQKGKAQAGVADPAGLGFLLRTSGEGPAILETRIALADIDDINLALATGDLDSISGITLTENLKFQVTSQLITSFSFTSMRPAEQRDPLALCSVNFGLLPDTLHTECSVRDDIHYCSVGQDGKDTFAATTCSVR